MTSAPATETRLERSQRLANAATRARRCKAMRADSLLALLLEERQALLNAYVALALHCDDNSPEVQLMTRLCSDVISAADVAREADEAADVWYASILPAADEVAR